MSVPAYPAYRDSGHERVGPTPAHWTITRLRFIARFNPSKSELGGLPPETEVSFLPMDAVGDDGSLRLDLTRPLGSVEQGYTYFRDGDLLIAKITPCFENGKGALAAGLLGGIGFGTTELIVVRPLPGRTVGQFLHWLFVSPDFRNAATAAMYGAGGQKRVPDEFVRDFVAAIPPPAEQHAIAAFLDRECGKIDGLVAEQERLIGLLKEKRQAVISHAVTKGLDPNAPMKDSGVAWLGQVPAHWEVKRLKQFAGGVTVGVVVMPSQYYAEEGVPALRSLNVREMAISLDSLVYFRVEANNILAKSMLRTDDLVAIRTGKPGTTAVVPPELDGANCIDLILIRRSPRFVSRFLGYVMNSPVCHIQYAEGSEGALQQHFNIETAGNLRIALPPLNEQAEIVAFLNATVGGIDTLTAEAERAIALLKERRAALISAAVTGKIDVRGLVAPPEAQAA